MRLIMNLFITVFQTLWIWLIGLASLLMLLVRGIAALLSSGGTWKSRIAGVFTAPEGQRLVFSVLRAFCPNLALGRVFVKAYENTGTAIVTRNDDVHEVLDREAEFEVVYGPRMRRITDGENFFLGMQNTPAYTRDTSNMNIAVRRDDVSAVIVPTAARQANEIVAKSGGTLDLPRDLTLEVPAAMVADYFGTPGPTTSDMIDWTTLMFWYLFIDLAADPDLDARAMDAAAKCRAYLDQAIRDRKTSPTDADDVLNRCLEMQKAGLPGMDDLGIRNNLIGLVIGAIPTISKASTLILDQLLDRPDALRTAQMAARNDDDRLLAACLFEAFRFNPMNPVIYRRAVRDVTVAKGTLRACRIRKGSLVFAANFSSMFDPLKISAPTSFRTDRPWEDYMLWGYGMHTCFGAHINHAIIPAILKPLLKQNNLRRAEGKAGKIDTGGTPFPVHMHVRFDPS